MAKVQINDLDAATTPLDGTELVEIEQAGQSAQCTTQDIAALAGAPYLKYVALLSQADTDAPVATVLENTLGGAVVWTRDDIGVYVATLADAFTANKTAFFVTTKATDKILAIESDAGDADNIYLYSINNGVPDDECLENTPIEIRVYP